MTLSGANADKRIPATPVAAKTSFKSSYWRNNFWTYQRLLLQQFQKQKQPLRKQAIKE